MTHPRAALFAAAFALTVGTVATLGPAEHPANASTAVSYSAPIPSLSTVMHSSHPELRKNLRCLALNIYFEARSEPVAGQIAVAAVTLNRVESARFPADICGVVRQGGERRKHRCQFSWWCDGKKDDPKDATAWRKANTLARLASAGVVDDPTGGALWYHADYVNPKWAKAKEKTAKIGRHIFYKLPVKEPVRLSDASQSLER